MAEESNRKSSQEEQYYDSDSYNCRGSSEVYILYHAEGERASLSLKRLTIVQI